jgi:hypothetical protein
MTNWAQIDRRDCVINAFVFTPAVILTATVAGVAAYVGFIEPTPKAQTQPLAQASTVTVQLDQIFAAGRNNIDPVMLGYYGQDCVKYPDGQVIFAMKDPPKDKTAASNVIVALVFQNNARVLSGDQEIATNVKIAATNLHMNSLGSWAFNLQWQPVFFGDLKAISVVSSGDRSKSSSPASATVAYARAAFQFGWPACSKHFYYPTHTTPKGTSLLLPDTPRVPPSSPRPQAVQALRLGSMP